LVLLAGLAWPFMAGIGLQVERISIRHAIKQRIKAGVPEGDRVVFLFTARELDDLDWEEERREFRRNGRMYDVVESHQLPEGTIKLACIDDEQETRLFVRLDSLTDLALGERMASRPLSFLACSPPVNPLGLGTPERSVVQLRADRRDRAFLSGHLRLPDPPPWG
jgi:hypothetical protein